MTTTINPNSPWIHLFQTVENAPSALRPESYPQIVHFAHKEHIALLKRIAIETEPELAPWTQDIIPLDFTKYNRTEVTEVVQNFSDLITYRLMDLCKRIIEREALLYQGNLIEKRLFEQGLTKKKPKPLFPIRDPTLKVIEIFQEIVWAEQELENGSREQAMMLHQLWCDEESLRSGQWDFQMRDSNMRAWWDEVADIRSKLMWDAARAQMSMDIPSMTMDPFISPRSLLWPWINREEERHKCSLKEYTYC